MKKTTLLIATLIIIPVVLHAQLTITAEIRPRAEMRKGYKQLSDTTDLPAVFVSQRSRLSLEFNQNRYRIYFSLQDVRVWGDETNYSSTGITGDNASIDLKEAWGEYFFTDKLSLKFGRQEIKYADQRLLAARNWNQHGMSYDALLLKYHGSFICDAGISYNNDKELLYQEYFSTGKMKTLDFLFLSKQLNDHFRGSILYVLSGFQNPDKEEGIYFRHTPGALVDFSLGNLTVNGSAYYQSGKNSKGNDVSAYFWNLSSVYAFPGSVISAGIDYISGHNFASTDSSYLKKDHLFDLLYGARHRYYGHMDHFSNLSKGTGGGGLIDVYAGSEIGIGKSIEVQAAYHYFRLQNNVQDPETEDILNKSLGNEIDLSISYRPVKEIKLEAGYSILLSTKSLNKLQNVSVAHSMDAHRVYVMCTFTPSLTLNKKEEQH
ncbi:MAG: alginate export family protein [Bacteroidales bacterium]|jgi:hypothetical protein